MRNRLILENLCYRPIRTLLSVLAIGIEVTMILTLVGISYGTLDEAARHARGVGADILVRPPGASVISLSTSPMSQEFLPFFMKQPHVTFATGTMIQPLSGLDTLTGVDLADFDKLSGGFRFLKGGPFEHDDDLIVDEYYAREKKLTVGSTIELMNRPWRVSGIFESGKLARVCAQLTVLQRLTGSPRKLSQIYLKVDDPNRAQPVVDDLRAKLPCSARAGATRVPRGRPSSSINYDLHRSNDDPDVWILYENWKGPSDLAAHFELPYMKAFLAVLPRCSKAKWICGIVRWSRRSQKRSSAFMSPSQPFRLS